MAVRFALYLIATVVELCISVVVHVCYGAWIMGTAITLDLLGYLSEEHRKSSSRVVPLMASGLAPLDGEVMEISADARGAVSPPENKSAAGAFLDVHSKAPIVMLHGIFGFGKGKLGRLSYWGGAELKDDRILVPDLGSLTSVHDRAVELFYFLKGGTVDYGVRAEANGHSRFGRTYSQGHYVEWDENHPVHLLGHSTGVQVARCLQQLLAEKAFNGHRNTSEDWVLSITSLSGALNGTTRVHVDGISEEDGRTMRSLCLLQVLRLGVLLYDWLDVPALKKYYSFGFDHYNLTWRKTGLKGLFRALTGQAGPFAHANWILPDLSIHAAVKFNHRVQTYPNTFYFSYATKKTRNLFGLTLPSSLLGIHPLLLLRAFQMCLWRFTRPPYDGYRDEEWEDNDGALNTKSQLFPCVPAPHPNHRLGSDIKDGHTLKPGIWYYTILEADHIAFIIDRDRSGVHFDILYDSIFQRCRKQMQRTARRRAEALCKSSGDSTCTS